MITLEQIRLLEEKIARAIELIKILKEENAALRKGLDSAQKRMKDLETMVDGFKSDQKEIESVILRTIKNLDELEESTQAAAPESAGSAGSHHAPAGRNGSPRPMGNASSTAGVTAAGSAQAPAAASGRLEAAQGAGRIGPTADPEDGSSGHEENKGQLDIF